MSNAEEKRIQGTKKKSSGALDFLKSRGRAWILVGGVVLGALLLMFGSGWGEENVGAESESVMQRNEELEEYRTALEKRLEKICDAVDGVGSVEVMVTLECGYRTVYTADGGGDPVTVGTGSNQQALYRTTQPPTVAGVAVVCNGGNNAHVQRVLTDLISTALGISSNRVCVAGK